VKYKVAILGCGAIATQHAPAVKQIPDAVLDSAADINAENLNSVCDAYGIPNRYGSLDELLEKGKPDIIIDATLPTLHLENVKKMCTAGVKGILCEKPMALSSAKAAKIVSACRKAKVKLMEGFMFHHQPMILRAKKVIDAGGLGAFTFIRATLTSFAASTKTWRMKRGAGGCIFDLGGYVISAARFFAGREPKSVFAVMKDTKTGVNEFAAITLDFGGGLLAQLLCSYSSAHQESVELYGTEAVAEMERYVVTVGMETALRIKKMGWSAGHDERREIKFPIVNTYGLETANLIDAVDKKKKPLVPDDDGVKNLKVIEACFESARLGRPVKFRN